MILWGHKGDLGTFDPPPTHCMLKKALIQPRPQGLLRTWRVKNEKTLVKAVLNSVVIGLYI